MNTPKNIGFSEEYWRVELKNRLKSASVASDSPNQSNETRARFTCNCSGETRVQSETLVLHDCKAQPGCKVFDYPRGFVRWIRVQINPQLTGGTEKYNWFVDWQSNATSD